MVSQDTSKIKSFSPHQLKALESYLGLLTDFGIETLTENEKINWQALPTRNAKTRPVVLQDAAIVAKDAPPTALKQGQEAIESAKSAASQSNTLAELKAQMLAFEGCSLKRTAKQLVFGAGLETAKVMFVGEAPSRDEDEQGLPIAGKSAQLFEKMLAAIGLTPQEVFVSNVLPWRPPGNRTPTLEEVAICLPFLQRQIELVRPQIIVSMGALCVQSLLGIKEGILKARGREFKYQTPQSHVPILVTLHPSYLLVQPLQKRLAWQDLKKLQSMLRETS